MISKALAAVSALLVGASACSSDVETGPGAGGGGGDPGGSTSSTGATTSGGTSSTGDGGASTGPSSTGPGGSTGSSGGGAASASSTSTGGGGGCIEDLSPGHHEVSCDGIAYDVEIPPGCEGGTCGLIVDIHGYTMTGDAEDANTGMRARGQQNGYVVVQPTAPVDGFGLPSWDQHAHAPLVYQVVADLAAALPVDPARVHAMGFSQGGGMTFRLLCDHADFFASGAPIGALAGCEFEGRNTPSEEVDILQVHGRDDAIVNFENVAVPQRDDALAAWPFGPPAVLEEDGAHRATRWETSEGTVFEFWEHDYVTSVEVFFVALRGHCVPGGDDLGSSGYSCEDPGTFVFGELAMEFFLAHPRD